MNFEKCSLLLVDPDEGYLYKFFISSGDGSEEAQMDSLKGKRVRFASTQGFTAQAIADRDVSVILNGKTYSSRAAEVDKVIKIANIENVMIGPCFDFEGKIKGVVQLFNKHGSQPINDVDKAEFKCLLPSVAEIIKHADSIKSTTDLNNNIYLSLMESKKKILESKDVENQDMKEAQNCLTEVA